MLGVLCCVALVQPALAAPQPTGLDTPYGVTKLPISVDGQTALTMNADLSGATPPQPTLTFTGPITESATSIQVDGTTVIGGTTATPLTVNGNTTITGNASITGAANVTGQLTVGGNTMGAPIILDASTGTVYATGGFYTPIGSGPTLVEKKLYSFGGIYTTGANCDDNACRYPNPITGACGCPSGYSPSEFWEYESNTGVYADANPACFTSIHWVKVYQCY